MMYELIATATFGLESIVAKELKKLGYDNLKVENARITFEGDEYDIALCNMWLRCADRVLIKMAEFKAESFEELYQGTLNVNWGDIIPENGFMHVVGKSVKSKLHSVPDCQSIVKKAVVESMKKKYEKDWFQEDGPEYKIEVAILKDVVTLTLDTTGQGLHKRGYRKRAGDAPMKETLAAAMVYLSNWNNEKILIDPCCGSGTIAIEAALIGKNIAPGINRNFVSESWPQIPKEIWDETREFARNRINDDEIKLMATDINRGVLKLARENAKSAGVAEYIHFQEIPIQEFLCKKKYVTLISNPPYGERIGEKEEIEDIYKTLGKLYRENDTWSLYIITSNEQFQRNFGRKADKNRKLYNGRLQCYYYQYIR
ncbi:class I SAM-dependent RNA methyltransferase [Haloimpatiens sp. FM7315]|uniref:THUMP domain-containing class I SAM-dependent RNA methyltransferase n=1 Tax=Haloimpatiens sp. FM7315 TaxID=3298609 RepID=UPI0035A26AC2